MLVENSVFKRVVCFLLANCMFVCSAFAAGSTTMPQVRPELPSSGLRQVHSSTQSEIQIMGMKLFKNQSLIEFYFDRGENSVNDVELNAKFQELVRYVFAGIILPNEDFWVNLSPNEPDRIMEETLANTELGKEMLFQDYILKQYVSSLLSPETEIGQEYWTIYNRLQAMHKSVPNLSSKVFIKPKLAQVEIENDEIYITSSELNVDLNIFEATSQNYSNELLNFYKTKLLPAITKEVNNGEYFKSTRQLYNALILSKVIKEDYKNKGILKYVIDSKKIEPVRTKYSDIKEELYEHYLKSYNEGPVNFTKKVIDPVSGRKVKRHYFSGGQIFIDIPLEKKNSISSSMSNKTPFYKHKIRVAYSERKLNDIASDLKEKIYDEGGIETKQRTLTIEEKNKLSPKFPSLNAFRESNWTQEHPRSKQVFLIRHMEAISNLLNITQTTFNMSSGTDMGYRQAKFLAKHLSENFKFDTVISSDSERAYETVRILVAALNERGSLKRDLNGEIPTDFRLAEKMMFPVAGVPIEIAKRVFDEADLFTKFPGEFKNLNLVSFKDFLDDVSEFYFDIENYLPDGDVLAVGTHQRSIVFQLMALFGLPVEKFFDVEKMLLPDKQHYPNAGVTVVAFDPDKKQWELLVSGDNTFLPEDLQNGTKPEHIQDEIDKFVARVKIRRRKYLENNYATHPIHRDYYPQDGKEAWQWNIKEPSIEDVIEWKKKFVALKPYRESLQYMDVMEEITNEYPVILSDEDIDRYYTNTNYFKESLLGGQESFIKYAQEVISHTFKDPEVSKLVRESWMDASYSNNSYVYSLIKSLYEKGVQPRSLANLVHLIVGLGVDVNDVWTVSQLVSDVLGYMSKELLGADLSKFKEVVRVVDNELVAETVEDKAFNVELVMPVITEDDDIESLKMKYVDFRAYQEQVVVAEENYKDVAAKVQDDNNYFYKKLAERVQQIAFEKLNLSVNTKSLMYFHNIKTFASDFDLIYFGVKNRDVEMLMTRIFYMIGVKIDLWTNYLIESRVAVDLAPKYPMDFYGGDVIPIENGTHDFEKFYKKVTEDISGEKMVDSYHDKLAAELTKWKETDIDLSNFKKMYYKPITHLLMILAIKYKLGIRVFGDEFFDSLDAQVVSDGIEFNVDPEVQKDKREKFSKLRDAYYFINQMRNIFAITYRRRWTDGIDENKIDDELLKSQGMGTLAECKQKLKDIGVLLDEIFSARFTFKDSESREISNNDDSKENVAWRKVANSYTRMMTSGKLDKPHYKNDHKGDGASSSMVNGGLDFNSFAVEGFRSKDSKFEGNDVEYLGSDFELSLKYSNYIVSD